MQELKAFDPSPIFLTLVSRVEKFPLPQGARGEVKTMTKNAYIHIPFCTSKCNYCSFVSFERLELKEQYLYALISQIKAEYKDEKLNTIYFGGGTPSLLTIDEFDKLLKLFTFEKDAEITVEVNPDSIDLNYLKGLKNLGINRLSIGSQTFDDEILKIIGRRHSSEQIKLTVEWAKKAGFGNISLDFIYGLPSQSIDDFEIDLKTACESGIQHISLYGLKIEEGCYFHQNRPKNSLPDSDIQADMYLKAVDVLKNAGFEHYEISNFSLSGFNSRHNLNYWNNNTYYGFGCSASGYINVVGQVCPAYDHNLESRSGIPARQHKSVRYTNEVDLNKYVQNSTSKDFEQELTEQEILEEAIFLGLRKIEGINIGEINQKFGIDFNKKYAKILDKYSDFFVKTKHGWALTLDGTLISNEILSEFLG